MKVKVADHCSSPFVKVGNRRFVKNSFTEVPDSFDVSDHRDVLVVEGEDTDKEENYSSDSDMDKMINDYIDQNARTVRKSIREDNLSEGSLKKLKEAEEQGKDRVTVIREIEKELGE